MSKKKKKQTIPSNLHPNSCAHVVAHCVVIDYGSLCSTCAAQKIAAIAQHIPPRAISHYVELTDDNAEWILDRLHALHAEMKEQARQAVLARTGQDIVLKTGSGENTAPEYGKANKLSKVLYLLQKHWTWKTTGTTKGLADRARENYTEQSKQASERQSRGYGAPWMSPPYGEVAA